jgi:hypothetical protein
MAGPKDDMVLEAAVSAGCSSIITFKKGIIQIDLEDIA